MKIITVKIPNKTHLTYGVEFYCSDDKNFLKIVFNRFKKSFMFDNSIRSGMSNKDTLSTFIQGNDQESWFYFEFFNGENFQDYIMNTAKKISDEFNIDFDIC